MPANSFISAFINLVYVSCCVFGFAFGLAFVLVLACFASSKLISLFAVFSMLLTTYSCFKSS